jgi:acyl-CoA thioesterase FadM
MENGFVMQRRVEFMDTDMAGIVHFTAYFRYMMSSRCISELRGSGKVR